LCYTRVDVDVDTIGEA